MLAICPTTFCISVPDGAVDVTQMTARVAESDDTDRYGIFETGDGGHVLYDRDNAEAWLQSDYTVEVGDPAVDVGPRASD